MSLVVESLAIGDELLDGRLADTNSREIADALAPYGVTLARAACVGDDVGAIAEAVLEAAARADVVVTSGGLGPTTDDVTALAVARAAGRRVRLDEETFAHITRRFEERGVPMPENNRRQAELPEGAEVLGNDAGIAPGFVTRIGGAEVFSLPGVPREYRWILEHKIMPALRGRFGDGVVERRTIRCLGITESALGTALQGLEARHRDVLVQYRTSFPENHARLVVRGGDRAAVKARADALAEEAMRAIGGAAYGIGDETLAGRLVAALSTRGATLALAESCTGGLAGKHITDVPGASRCFLGGVVAYADEVKRRFLDVDPALLARHGAVSEEVAAAMAEGAKQRFGADYALSITGVAGPAGGTDDKPVGTVCFGLSSPAGTKAKRRLLFGGGREQIRELSVAVALRYLLVELEGGAREQAGPVAQ